MGKIQNKYEIFITTLRLSFIRFFSKKKIVFGNNIRIAKCVSLEPCSNGELYLGEGIRIERNSLIAVRENAVLSIGSNTYINRNANIVSRNKIIIGCGCSIGPNFCMYDHDHNMKKRGEFLTGVIEVGNDTWIGANVVILKNVKIGSNVVIAAGSVITSDIPDNSVVIQKRVTSLYSTY